MEFFESWSWSGFIFNVICSLIASFGFIILLLFCLKPKFHIAEYIAHDGVSLFGENHEVYMFKVLNKSFFAAYDVNVELHLLQPVRGEKKITNKFYKKLTFRSNQVSYVPGRFMIPDGDNAMIFVTHDDLESHLAHTENYLQIRLTARHALTGLTNVINQEYVSVKNIKQGKYKSGNTFDIM